jgi:uncharacterized protein involved in cysteine biosynthesis
MKTLFAVPTALVRGVRDILTDRKLVSYCIVPIIIGIVSFLIGLVVTWEWRNELTATLFGAHQGIFGYLSGMLAILVGIALSALSSWLVSLGLGAYFIDALAERLLVRYGLMAPTAESLTALVRTVSRGVIESIKRLVAIGALSILFLIFGWIPLFTIPLLALSAFLAGADILDIPQAVMQRTFRERLALTFQHKLWCLSIGAVFLVSLVIPFATLLVLPPLVAATIVRMDEWRRS